MTCTACAPAASTPAAAPTKTRGLSPNVAFYLLASINIAFFAGSSAPTPLYPLYQADWGFSPITVTFVFGIYAVALLGALLVTGRLSDHVGRRPVLIVATLTQAATMLLFTTADGLNELLFARVIQGLSTGVAIAAVGAAMLDLDKARGAVANAVAPPLGSAVGGIVAGLMVHFLPAPTHLVYDVLGAIFIFQAIAVLFMAETISPRAGAIASLRPQFKLPAATREPLLLAIPILVATWALVGFYASLGPAVIGNIFGLDSSLLGGLALFVLAGSGALSILVLQHREAHTMMSFGAAGLLAGMAVAIIALSIHSAPLFFIGTAIAGVGLGAGFQGAVRTIVQFAAPAERAGVLSVIFVVCYLAMSVPAVIAGYLVALQGNLLLTAREFGAVVMVLATLALIGAMITRSKRERRARA